MRRIAEMDLCNTIHIVIRGDRFSALPKLIALVEKRRWFGLNKLNGQKTKQYSPTYNNLREITR